MAVCRIAVRVLSLVVAGLSVAPALQGADCNGNGIDDASDLLAQNFGFLAASSYPVENLASAIVADLSGDGKPDIAVSTQAAGQVAVLLNQGDGTFQRAVTYPMGRAASRLTATDLNADGKPDIVVPHNEVGQVSVLLNQGDGTFKDAVTYSVGSCLLILVVVELNGDDTPDIAIAESFCDRGISVLLNEGDGTFRSVVSYAAPSVTISLVAADFDGDGRSDLAMLDGYVGEISVVLNEGDGTFKAAVSYSAGADFLRAADFNGDGKPDIAGLTRGSPGGPFVEPEPSRAFVLLNQGDGAFDTVNGRWISPPVGDARSYASLIAADLDGDGKPDLAMSDSYSNDVSLFINHGDGTFQSAVTYPIGRTVGSLNAADLNGDGKVDLATTNWGSADVTVLLNQGDGTFTGATTYPVGKNPGSLNAADLNGDGKVDLATVNLGSRDITILLNHTTLPFSLDLDRNGRPDECEPGAFHRGDPNNDGSLNIADPIALFNFLFRSGEDPACMDSADADNDGQLGISDGVSLLEFLFRGGPPPAAPGPPRARCGLSPPESTSDLGCLAYDHCP